MTGLKERAEAAADFALNRAILFGDSADAEDKFTSARERELASLLYELAAAVPSEAAIRSAVEAEREACAVTLDLQAKLNRDELESESPQRAYDSAVRGGVLAVAARLIRARKEAP